MPIISVEITKTIDEREMQKTSKEKQTKTKRSKGNRSCSEMVRAKWFCCEQDSLYLLSFLNHRCPNIKLTIEEQISHFIAFLDVFNSGINNQNLTL